MSFRAMYPVECGGCGRYFDEGAEVEYDAGGELLVVGCCGEGEDELDFDPDDDCPGEAVVSELNDKRDADNCERCNYDTHRCPGCGGTLSHGKEICDPCDQEFMAEEANREADTDYGRYPGHGYWGAGDYP